MQPAPVPEKPVQETDQTVETGQSDPTQFEDRPFEGTDVTDRQNATK